jgi:hypothetical protein
MGLHQAKALVYLLQLKMRTGNLPAVLGSAHKVVFALALQPSVAGFASFYHAICTNQRVKSLLQQISVSETEAGR